MIGKYMALKRKELGISRKELSNKLGISYNYVTLLERGKHKPSKQLKEKIAKLLDIPLEEIEKDNMQKTEKKMIQQRIKDINKELVKIETNKILLEKERDYLSGKLVVLNEERS